MSDGNKKRGPIERINHIANNVADEAGRWLMLGLGWIFVLIGVAGLFLPFLQGIVFLVIGFIILARASPRVRLLRQRVRRRYPKFFGRIDWAEDRARDWLRRHLPRWLSRRIRQPKGGGA